jgi:hypothetical protein
MKNNSILYLIVCAGVSMHSMVCPMNNRKRPCAITIPTPTAQTHALQRVMSLLGTTTHAPLDSDSEDSEIVVKHRPPPIHIAPPPATKSLEITQSASIMHRRRSTMKPSGTA